MFILGLLSSTFALPAAGTNQHHRHLLQETPSATKAETFSPECAKAIASVKWTRHIFVSDSPSLQKALNTARAGDVIEMKPGQYSPKTTVNGNTPERLTIKDKKASRESPIIICGPKSAVINGDVGAGNSGGRKLQLSSIGSDDETVMTPGLLLLRVSFVRVHGIRITNTQLGVLMNQATNCRVEDVSVHRIERTGFVCNYCSRTVITKSNVTQAFRGQSSMPHKPLLI